MKNHRMVGLGGSVASLILCTEASAIYTGLSVSLHSSGDIGGVQRNVWRVYANFSVPTDFLVAVAGSQATGNLVIESRNSTNTGTGSNFYNPIPTNRAPTQTQVFGGVDGNTSPIAPIPNAQWETFCTIGVDINNPAGLGDLTGLTPAFPGFITGNSLDSNNISWFLPGVPEQGRAGHWAGNRVLMMQLTTSATSNVRGTLALSWSDTGPLATGHQSVGQTFNSYVPTPVPLALFGLAGFANPRRRRASTD